MNLTFIKTQSSDRLNALRKELYQNLQVPIDAMWEELYIASSTPYLIDYEGDIIGYASINEEACLNQIFLQKEYWAQMYRVIEELIQSALIKSARLSSNEMISFNACLRHSQSLISHTLCFQHLNQPLEINTSRNIERVSKAEIPKVQSFYKEQVGLEDTFGYIENLVSRQALFILRDAELIIASSECRMSTSQKDIADLGIIVHRKYQGRGIAGDILRIQANRVLEAQSRPICSTTVDNIAAQKAIEKAGFYCSNIIFDINLKLEVDAPS